MILRLQISSIPPALIFFLFSFSVITTKADDTPFSCNLVLNDVHFDLSKLAGEHVLNRTRETPPTKTVDSLRFDLCAELAPQEALSEKDQCPTGTRVCLTQVNIKESDADRIVNVIPIVQSSKLDVKYMVSSSDQKFVNLIFDGPDYPHPSNSTPVTQHLNLTIVCGAEESTDPKMLRYDGSFLDIEWTTPAGCVTKDDPTPSPPSDGSPSEPEKAVGSGMGWFFLVVLLAFAAYFGLGAYYNYSTYGARGLDLIPHRDFWQEVPYMLKDVVSHLCSTVRPRRTQARNGYISV